MYRDADLESLLTKLCCHYCHHTIIFIAKRVYLRRVRRQQRCCRSRRRRSRRRRSRRRRRRRNRNRAPLQLARTKRRRCCWRSDGLNWGARALGVPSTMECCSTRRCHPGQPQTRRGAPNALQSWRMCPRGRHSQRGGWQLGEGGFH